MSFTPIEETNEMTVMQIKDMLHKLNIDNAGIYDKVELIRLLYYGNSEEDPTDIPSNLPLSYLELFQIDEERNKVALQRIDQYFAEGMPQINTKVLSSNSQQKMAKSPAHKTDSDCRLYIENVPISFTQAVVRDFFSKAGRIEFLKLYDDQSGKDESKGIRSILVVYTSVASAKKCYVLYNGKEFVKGYPIRVQRAEENKSNVTKKKELLSQSSVQSTSTHVPEQEQLVHKEDSVPTSSSSSSSIFQLIESDNVHTVELGNMFTEEQWKDREYMKELFEDVTYECNRFGKILSVRLDQSKLRILVAFNEEKPAQSCQSILHGRNFDGRVVTAVYCKPKAKDPIETHENVEIPVRQTNSSVSNLGDKSVEAFINSIGFIDEDFDS